MLRYKIKYLHMILLVDIQFMQIVKIDSIIQDINWNISIVSTCGYIFIDDSKTLLRVFSTKIGVCPSFQVELYENMFVIEFAN